MSHATRQFSQFRLRTLFSPLLAKRPERLPNTVDAARQSCPADERRMPDCGGFNEAFIVQHWASFQPRS